MLSKAIAEYLEWMISAGYADSTWNNYQRVLDRFQQFVQNEQLVWDDIFTWKTLQAFRCQVRIYYAGHAVRGLARYLFGQGLIKSCYWAVIWFHLRCGLMEPAPGHLNGAMVWAS